MPISTSCPSCQARIRLPDDAAGRRFRCPKCQGVVRGPQIQRKPPPNPAVLRPADEVDPGFVDAPPDPTESQLSEEPAPISSTARKAIRGGFNPFDDGAGDDDDGLPRRKRFAKRKDDYNPFAQAPAPEPTAGAADPGQLFDFGAVDPSQSSPAGEFDFNASDPSDNRDPRRRRR